MVSSRAEDEGDGGYATVSALGVSLAMGLLVCGLMLRAVTALKLARADYRRVQAEYSLDGVQLLAATKVLSNSGRGRLAWRAGAPDGQEVAILAEPEREKLGLPRVASIDARILDALGADEPEEARVRLAALDQTVATPVDVENADPSRDWRACAASAISPWGSADALSLTAPHEPNSEAAGARAGEVWRILTTTGDGWSEERIVRLAGRRDLPAAMIWRKFGRAPTSGNSCDKIIDQ